MLKSESYFILRVPLLPFHAADVLSDTELKRFFTEALHQEALFLASPTLYHRLQLFLNDDLEYKEANRFRLSLHKYLLRMARRATPFGLFAGITMGVWDKFTNVNIHEDLRRCTRLDTEYVSALADQLLRTDEISSIVKYFPNDTLYCIGSNLRFIECKTTNQKNEFLLSSLESDPYVLKVLEMAEKGLTKSALAQCIESDEIDKDEALSFVEEMISSRVLISELSPKLSGEDYFSSVRRVLRRLDVFNPMINEVESLLKDLDGQSPIMNLQTYPILIEKLRAWIGYEPVNNFIQVDSYRKSEIRIHEKVSSEVCKLVEILADVLPARESDTLKDFRAAFFEKYEYRSVDLCLAMDPGVGLCYPVQRGLHLNDLPLLKEIDFEPEHVRQDIRLTEFDKFLIGKYSEIIGRQHELVLTEQELKRIRVNDNPALPSSLYALISVYAYDSAAVDKGNFFVYFDGAYGPSCATPLARFSHLDSELAEALVQSLEREQEGSNSIFAELIHASQPRTGNISTRAILRRYEIPILASSSTEGDYRLPISDLTLSIVGDRLVLRSKKLNREVIPRLSSAHNYLNDTPSVYRLLCDLQFQNVNASVEWDWGVLSSASYLPRVRIGKTIVCAARWRISAAEVQSIKESSDPISVCGEIRKARQIPRYVIVAEADNKITIDLENINHVSILRQLLGRTDIVTETFENEGNCFVRNKNSDGYCHELIVPMIMDTKNPDRSAELDLPQSVGTFLHKRVFQLGSEWLYYKIFCGVLTADTILTDIIRPLTEELLSNGVIDKWFFVRYADPENHLRIRFHGQGTFYNVVIAEVSKRMEASLREGFVFSIATDTYCREIERYGHDNIETCESLFFADSQITVELLLLIGEDDSARWQIGMLIADQLLSIFNLSMEQKRDVLLDLQMQFFSEMKVDTKFKRSLATVLRNYRPSIENILIDCGMEKTVQQLIHRRGVRLRPLADSIRAQMLKCESPVSMTSLLKSFIHMAINRWSLGNPRQYELVFYDFLLDFYKSELVKRTNETAKL